MMKTVTIFGSSLPVPGEQEYEDAYTLGKSLALAGLRVCNGGNSGIMEASAKGAFENGGEAIGITIKKFTSYNKYLTERIDCETMFERMQKLVEAGDAYIVLQGGTGTLFELAVVWESINKGFLDERPFACHSAMWRDISAIMENQISREKRKTGLLKPFEDINECADYIIQSLL